MFFYFILLNLEFYINYFLYRNIQHIFSLVLTAFAF